MSMNSTTLPMRKKPSPSCMPSANGVCIWRGDTSSSTQIMQHCDTSQNNRTCQDDKQDGQRRWQTMTSRSNTSHHWTPRHRTNLRNYPPHVLLASNEQ